MKFRVFVIVLSILTSGVWGEEGSLWFRFAADDVLAGKAIKKDALFVWNLGITDSTRDGLSLTPYNSGSVVRQSKMEKLSTMAYLLARKGDTWLAYEKISQTTVKEYDVTKNVPAVPVPKAGVLEGNLGIVSSLYSRKVEVRLVTSGYSFSTLTRNIQPRGEVRFDPLSMNGQTFYLIDRERTDSTLMITLKDRYSFEDQHPALQGRAASLIRPVLMTWIMRGSAATLQTEAEKDLFKALGLVEGPSMKAESVDLRNSLLSLLRHQLQLQRPDNALTWAFPTGRIYETWARTDYDSLFFRYLHQQKFLTSPVDRWSDADLVSGQELSVRAREFLVGVETGTPEEPLVPPVLEAFRAKINVSTDNFKPEDARVSLGINFNSEALNAGAQEKGYGALGTYRFLFKDADATKNFFADALPVATPSESLLSENLLANYNQVRKFLRPVADMSKENSKTTTLQFKTSQTVQSLLLWVRTTGDAPSVTLKSANGGPFRAESVQATYWKPVLNNDAGFSTWVSSAGEKNSVHVVVLDLAYPIQVDQLQISGSAVLLNVRAYPTPMSDLNKGTWRMDDPQTLTVSSVISKSVPELFSKVKSNEAVYFAETGGGFIRPPYLGFTPDYFSPVYYLKGGLETPVTQALKSLINNDWKDKGGLRASRFPLTEFDVAKDKLAVDERFLYRAEGAATPVLSDRYKGFEQRPYLYPAGISVNSKTGAVAEKNSPLSAFKMAGVDSTGLLMSLVKTLDVRTRTNPSVKTLFDFRTALASYAEINGKLPNTGSDLNPTLPWFLDNSFVVPNLTDLQEGDLLVGTEGSEITVAVVVNSPSIAAEDTLADAMKKTQVVTIYRALQRAVFTTWSQMSLRPGDYHIRRLVALNGPDDQAPLINRIGFLQFDTSPGYSFELADDVDQFRFWVPNTGEIRTLGQVKLARAQHGVDPALANESAWELLGAWDYFGNQVAGGNISVNTDHTVFHVVALLDNRPENGISILDSRDPNQFLRINKGIEIASLTRNPGGNYDVRQNPALKDYSLVVENSTLVLKQGDSTLRYFGIVAENPRPGDDIGLRFRINTGYGFWTTDDGTARRLAVYDKKLLWRANLYIDKDGPKDWNNVHPWNAPIAINDWNHDQGGAAEGLGGQIPIRRFTSPRLQGMMSPSVNTVFEELIS